MITYFGSSSHALAQKVVPKVNELIGEYTSVERSVLKQDTSKTMEKLTPETKVSVMKRFEALGAVLTYSKTDTFNFVSFVSAKNFQH